MSVSQTIQQRISVRAYDAQPVPAAELQEILAFAAAIPGLTTARMEVVLDEDGSLIGQGLPGIAGDYGKLITAPHYLAILSEDTADYLVDAGYRFQRLILEATRRGLGTCWIGGFFSEPKLLPRLSLPSGFRAVAVTPLGYPARRGVKNALQWISRQAFGSPNRKPASELFHWQTPDQPLPPEAAEGAYGKLVEGVRRAPSWANKQPWRFIAAPGGILVYKLQRQMKEDKDYHLVDCGIAMAHIELIAAELGVSGAWDLQPAAVPGLPTAAELIAHFAFSSPLLPGA